MTMMNEQDFVLDLRRLHRLQQAGAVFQIIRHLPDYSKEDGDSLSQAVRDYAQRRKGEAAVMGNGDIFVSLPPLSDSEALEAQNALQALAFPDGLPQAAAAQPPIQLFHLPENYIPLREKANAYIELARAAELMGPVRQAELALQAEDVRGPLTAWSLAQVERLVERLDIRRYVRTQPVYTQGARGVWERAFTDFYVSIGDLKRERFPRLNLEAPERLFLELCCQLDRCLLREMMSQVEAWRQRPISLNLSAETVLSHSFAQFCHALPKASRPNVRFEIHRSDLFLNFTTTRNAIAVLHEEGFLVGIDGITPSVLPFIDFAALQADYYKINVTREKWPEMREAVPALERLPREKLVFSHVDHDEALAFGQSGGVLFYQGWLIDDVANAIVM